jgi:hypothetical protein
MALEIESIFEILWWHFFEYPKKIIKTIEDFLKFSFYYFSIVDLLKTLFAPWKGTVWIKTKRGFDFGEILDVFVSNLISRILGAIVRIFIIFFGLIFSAFCLILGIFFFLFWIFSPIIFIILFFYGISKLLF